MGKTGRALPLLCALWLAVSAARAADGDFARVRTTGSVVIDEPVAVTVVNSAPLQALLVIAAVAPVGVVFAVPDGGGAEGALAGAFSGPGGQEEALTSISGLTGLGGSLTGTTTLGGNAVSVSVGDMPSGTAPGSSRVPMLIAQYN